MLRSLFMLSLLCICDAAPAQSDTAKLNNYFTQLDTNHKAMASVCLSRNGSVVYERVIGFADVTENKRSDRGTLYRIGSISKMFTAVMILQLAQEKKLSLDTRLSLYYPSIKNSEKITIEHLLDHRSGIGNFTSRGDYPSYMEKQKDEGEMINLFEKLPSDFEPDTKFSYSNTNYVLLSFIIEKITGSTYAEQLQRRICEKVKLTDTKAGVKIDTDQNEAQSYNSEGGKWVQSTETDMSIPRGAGNIVSTAKDLCRFIEALFGGKLIAKVMLEKMKTMRDGYGYGMIQLPFGSKKFYGHTGGIDGFQSILAYNEEDKAAVCILGNGFAYSMNEIAIALLSAFYDRPYSIPSFEKRTPDISSLKTPEGIYDNGKLNMTLTVFRKDGNLMAQAKGQSAFPLTKVADLEYKYEAAGIQIIFVKENDDSIRSLKLRQGGMDLLFSKE